MSAKLLSVFVNIFIYLLTVAYFLITCISPAFGFGVEKFKNLGRNHQDITRTALDNTGDDPFEVTLSGGEVIRFSDKAIDDIIAVNVAVDDDQATASKHFDSESFFCVVKTSKKT